MSAEEPPSAAAERAPSERAIEAIWRIESPKLIAKLARMLRDVGVAQEIAQEAWLAALEQWPASGVPDHPGAWLMATAKNRAIDELRRLRMKDAKHSAIAHDPDLIGAAAAPAEDPDAIDDDLLRLIFVACHPVLGTEARAALTLRLLGGLTTEEIARAFLVSEAAIQQRIVRAKRTLAEAHVPFEVPGAAQRAERLASVLEVIYLIFNEGYAATTGDEWTRPALCEEALRLGRTLAALAPEEAEVHGLLALMELQSSRLPARVSPSGEPILLLEQNRLHWDQLLIRRGLAALERAEAVGGVLGPYALQASIAACHARAVSPEATDWPRIVALYDALHAVAPSPIVALNRAVAVSMAYGPGAALELIDALCALGRLSTYHLLSSVRGDLLEKLGRLEEARAEYSHAAALASNARERELLRRRAAALTPPERPRH
jgi:RNA polymerase sigma-70 factor (ECF subfamily)